MAKLIIPPGMKTGCLPRKSKIGSVSPMASERIDIIDPEDWPPFIAAGDSVEDHISLTYWQGDVGSCATDASSGAVQAREEASGSDTSKRFNPWFVYYHTSGGRDQGSVIDENLAFIRDNGIATDEVWPRYDKRGNVVNLWNRKPSDAAYEDALNHRIDEFWDITSIVEVGSCLCARIPVVFGWQGHSCFLTKLVSRTSARYKNSWGADWGNDGYGVIDLREINFAYGAFGVRSIRGR